MLRALSAIFFRHARPYRGRGKTVTAELFNGSGQCSGINENRGKIKEKRIRTETWTDDDEVPPPTGTADYGVRVIGDICDRVFTWLRSALLRGLTGIRTGTVPKKNTRKRKQNNATQHV